MARLLYILIGLVTVEAALVASHIEPIPRRNRGERQTVEQILLVYMAPLVLYANYSSREAVALQKQAARDRQAKGKKSRNQQPVLPKKDVCIKFKSLMQPRNNGHRQSRKFDPSRKGS